MGIVHIHPSIYQHKLSCDALHSISYFANIASAMGNDFYRLLTVANV